nr:hypothetical protein MACL_00003006 [Theileria orientalis]
MESGSPTDELDTPNSSRKRQLIRSDSNYTQSENSQSDDNESAYEPSPKHHSVQHPTIIIPVGNRLDSGRINRQLQQNTSPYNNFQNPSIDIPAFDQELLQTDYMSQNIFDQGDNQSVRSDARDDCQIVNIVHSSCSNNSSVTVDSLNRFNMFSSQNGSTSDPILVEDSANTSLDGTNHDPNANGLTNSNCESNDVEIAADTSTQNSSTNLSTANLINASDNREQDNDDCIMGPIHWSNKRPSLYPLDYYRANRNFSNAYKFLDTERPAELNSLDDIEFLFKCPICYSTITRLRSGKVPNENDKVIYSTKCGHLFCYECIENVRSRKECSICRKPVRDKYQYHVVFP